ncbi:hypothetical protein BG015_003567 [Linnemannia schmuckeri]|uniref:Uncharacterized protein n=1 Tax=Linnemannia schmuckeri TaxID=64567 RepID=A0A9P5V3X6_9FUNG|nr:hypothetical protein BG015_003567 [Linnemannia schmuckeri]
MGQGNARPVWFPLSGQEVSVFYVGITTRSPTVRAKEDQALTPSSRIGNLLRLDGGRVDTYEWTALSYPCGTSEADYRRHLVRQNVGRNLVALGGPYLANSASGGFTFDWMVPEHVKNSLGGFLEYVRYRSNDFYMASASRPSSHPTMQDLLVRHFRLMRDHFAKNRRPGETAATDECLEELIDGGSKPVLVRNQVVSAFLTKDITLEALAGVFAYDKETAGPAPRLEHHLRKCVGDLVSDFIDRDIFSSVRTDLFPCSTRHQEHQIALLFLSNYLCILQPILLVTHAMQVLHILQHNHIHKCWRSQDSRDQFTSSLEQQNHTHASLEAGFGQRVAGRWTSIKSDATYVEALGKFSVVKFGPGKDDYCIVLPERHAGNMRYNPALSSALSLVSFLTKCAYLIAIPHLVQYAQNRPPGSRQDTLVQLKNDIEDSVRKCGIRSLMEKTRDQLKSLSKELFRQRTQSANVRKAEDDPEGYEAWLRSRLAQLEAGRRENEVYANGLPYSPERKAQVDEIFAQVDDFASRGIIVKMPQIPSGLASRADQHHFLMSRPQGVGLVAACKPSALYMERVTLEGLEKRRQAVAEAGTRRQHQWITAIINLAQINFDKRNTYYYYAHCKDCSAEFLCQDKRLHQCRNNKSADKERLAIIPYFLYPHDLFDSASDQEKADMME